MYIYKISDYYKKKRNFPKQTTPQINFSEDFEKYAFTSKHFCVNLLKKS